MRAGVVVEAGGVVEAGRLGGALAKEAHSLGAVEEPPGRPEAQRRVVARERRELARVGRLVEREEDDQRQVRASLPKRSSSGLRSCTCSVRVGMSKRPLSPGRSVASTPDGCGCDARARVDLHDESVVDAHPRHLGEHLPAEHASRSSARRGAAPRHQSAKSRSALGVRRQIAGGGGGVAVIGRGRAIADPKNARAALPQAQPGSLTSVADGAPLRQLDRSAATFSAIELGKSGIDDRVGTEGGDHPPFQPEARDLLVVRLSESSGDSVVARTSMWKVSKSARGQELRSCARLAASIWS